MTRKVNIFAFSVIVFLLAISRSASAHASRYSTSSTEGFAFVVEQGKTSNRNRVYFCGNNHIVSLNEKTGKVVWSIKGPGFKNSGAGYGPVLSGHRLVYMADGGSYVAYGIDTRSGKLEWKVDQTTSALTASPHAVFLSGLGSILKVSSNSGKVEWKKDSNVHGWLSYFVYSNGLLFGDSSKIWSAKNGRLVRHLFVDPDVVASYGEIVYLWGEKNVPLIAENSLTGKILWKGKKAQKISPDDSGHVYLSVSSKYLVSDFYYKNNRNQYKQILSVYDAYNGNFRWKKSFISKQPFFEKPISVDNKYVYLIRSVKDEKNTYRLEAYNARSGKPVWSYLHSTGMYGPVVSMGGKVLFSNFTGGNSGGGVHGLVYALSRNTGQVDWVYREQ